MHLLILLAIQSHLNHHSQPIQILLHPNFLHSNLNKLEKSTEIALYPCHVNHDVSTTTARYLQAQPFSIAFHTPIAKTLCSSRSLTWNLLTNTSSFKKSIEYKTIWQLISVYEEGHASAEANRRQKRQIKRPGGWKIFWSRREE